MKRIEALRVIAEVWGGAPLVVTCGATARELASVAARPSHLYLLDSMGLAAAVGVGLGLAGHRGIGAVEGDGSLLMGLSVIATMRHLRPPGFTLIVLDNREHASAGGFPTQSVDVDLAGVIRSVGIPVATADHADILRRSLQDARARSDGSSAVVVSIERGNSANVPLLLEDPAVIAAGFTRALEKRA